MSLPEIPPCPPNQCMVLQIFVGWICLPGIQRHSHLSYCRMWPLSFPGFVLKIQPSYALIKGKLDFHSQQGRYIIGKYLKYTLDPMRVSLSMATKWHQKLFGKLPFFLRTIWEIFPEYHISYLDISDISHMVPIDHWETNL